MQFKNIKNNGKTFLLRFGCKFKKGSIKLHIITDDDPGVGHTHPWDFKSLILFGGYVEKIFLKDEFPNDVEIFHNKTDGYFLRKTYGWLSVNRKTMNVHHHVSLRRLFGFKIPAITIGYYGEKKQLCSLCKELGYCRSRGK